MSAAVSLPNFNCQRIVIPFGHQFGAWQLNRSCFRFDSQARFAPGFVGEQKNMTYVICSSEAGRISVLLYHIDNPTEPINSHDDIG